MNKEYDSLNYDKATIYVKKKLKTNIIKSYKHFGWKVLSEKKHKRFSDIIKVIFIRPHKIENKDDLQILQVYMEEKFNDRIKIERKKYFQSFWCGILLGLVSLFFISCGVSIIFKANGVRDVINIVLLILIGLIYFVINVYYLPKLIRKERREYRKNRRIIDEDLAKIYYRVINLSGEENDGR